MTCTLANKSSIGLQLAGLPCKGLDWRGMPGTVGQDGKGMGKDKGGMEGGTQ